MRLRIKHLSGAIIALAMALPAAGQSLQFTPASTHDQVQPSDPPQLPAVQAGVSPAPVTSAVQQLLAFTDRDIKFPLSDLMAILRDSRHEGWVLAAYPDPKTGHPLIGAGFTLDLPARDHSQPDAQNPHPFIEPSSAELWQTAGLDPQRLQATLDRFDHRFAAWGKKGFRRKITGLTPEITDEDANLLLRVAAIQAAYNAKGYCRNFDRLSASQQMALAQMVYQMGVNLQHFTQFLNLINGEVPGSDASVESTAPSSFAGDGDYWTTVQKSLLQSQWARLYRIRAVSVIAMLDPQYLDGPQAAEQRVGAMLRPAVVHRRLARAASSRQVASHPAPGSRGRSGGSRSKAHRQRRRGVYLLHMSQSIAAQSVS